MSHEPSEVECILCTRRAGISKCRKERIRAGTDPSPPQLYAKPAELGIATAAKARQRAAFVAALLARLDSAGVSIPPGACSSPFACPLAPRPGDAIRLAQGPRASESRYGNSKGVQASELA